MEKLKDMHTHSIYSDGTDTVEEIVTKAEENDIDTIAITDHDNIEGSKIAVKYNTKNLKIYSGIELTASKSKLCRIELPPNARIHILGYNIDLDSIELNETLETVRKSSIHNILMYYEIMTRLHPETKLPEEEIDKLISTKSNIGRPQLADLLIKYGICKDRDDAFDNYLNEAYTIAKSKKLTTGLTEEECIELITKAGGVPILAHPNSLKLSFEDLEKRIVYLKSIGLKGLETTHIHLNEEERDFLKELCRKYDLLESGGTDYHGSGKPDVELGTGKNNNVKIYRLSLLDKVPNRYAV